MNAGVDPIATLAEDGNCGADVAPRLLRVVLVEICSREDVVGSERRTSKEKALGAVVRGVALEGGSGGGRSERER